ncbi:hypothetical protein ACFCXA_30320 [Streptomyces virginiae]|uniref:hypothetical protein n=1 Tax=Streptomyces virginiae TaxID=1961 RepID=UPI00324A38A8
MSGLTLDLWRIGNVYESLDSRDADYEHFAPLFDKSGDLGLHSGLEECLVSGDQAVFNDRVRIAPAWRGLGRVGWLLIDHLLRWVASRAALAATHPYPIDIPISEAIASVESHCGRPVLWEIVSSRRGSTVWKGTGPAASVALKAGQDEGAPITSRETTVAEHMPGHSPLIASGSTRTASWLITPWHDGLSTWDVFHTVRTTHQGTQEARDTAVDLCLAVGDLHRQDWVHGDLEPDHAIHTKTGIQLIDCT